MKIIDLNTSILIAGVLLIMSVFASKVSTRYGIPALILFIAIGMLAGSEGFGGIEFENYSLAYSVGVLALVLILFGGGLESSWKEISPIIVPGLSLATLGVAITAGTIGLFAHWIAGLSLMQGLLLGAIVSSTDAAAVFGVLRAQKLKLRGRLTPLLEFESGSNDPMAVFLTIGITGLMMSQEAAGWMLLPELLLELAIGLIGGIAVGALAARLMNKLHLEYDGLYHVLTIAIAFIAFGGVQAIGGSGFLAVYVCGAALSSKNFVHKVSLIQFHEGLGWLMQIAMFLCLGLLVFPSHLLPDVWANLLLALFLVLIARPLAVLVSLAFSRSFDLPQKLFVSWVGLRGAVPIILATIPLMRGVPGASGIFNAVFFIVLVSVMLQGTTISWIARRLEVVSNEPLEISERRVSSHLMEVKIPEHSPAVNRSVVELNLPTNTLLVLLTRGTEGQIPRGATVIESGDVVLFQADEKNAGAVKEIFLGPGKVNS